MRTNMTMKTSKARFYPNYPLYIVSKGRHEYMITSKALTKMGVFHRIVVEPDQVKDYKKAIETMKLSAEVLEMDMTYKDKYELCDDLGLTRSTGPGPARNFAWDHSIKLGYDWHWVMDDNIRNFKILNYNERIKCEAPGFWRAMEDFVLRYKNIGMAGPDYQAFTPDRNKLPPFLINTRIYSCNFIRNSLRYRWRGRYNEDTILSLDILKAGWCTVQFYMFLQEKMQTQALKGGNTSEFYLKEGSKNGKKYADTGTLAKSMMMVKVHPDVSKVTYLYSRIHHHVNYNSFKKNKLILRDDIVIPNKPIDYGLKLRVKSKES